jgi:hypothetical protein
MQLNRFTRQLLATALGGCLLATAFPLYAGTQLTEDAVSQLEPELARMAFDAVGSQDALKMENEAATQANELSAVLVKLFHQESLAQQAEQVSQNDALRTPQFPALLGVEQIRTTPDGSSMQTPQSKPAPKGSLQSADVRPGKNAEALPQAQTSANCGVADSSAECLLLSKPAQDWRNQTGAAMDPLTGAPLIPGGTLNLGAGMNPGMMQGSSRQ